MSIKRTSWTYLKFLVLSVLSVAGLMAQEETDPVLDYYWTKAATAYGERNLGDLDIPYRVEAVILYKNMNNDGQAISTDSVGLSYFFTGSAVDSQITIFGDAGRLSRFSLQVINVFDSDYRIFSFPNDTGGAGLPIGFDTEAGSTDPTGFVIIDRNTGYLRWLYLHYSQSPGYRRLSRGVRMADFQGYMFPDSVWEIGARDGFFSSENYRIEARITNVELLQKTK